MVLLVLVQGIGAVPGDAGQLADRARDHRPGAASRASAIFRRLHAQNQSRARAGRGDPLGRLRLPRRPSPPAATGTIVSVLRNHGARARRQRDDAGRRSTAWCAPTRRTRRATASPSRTPVLVTEAAAERARPRRSCCSTGALYQLVVVPVLAPDPIAWVGLAFEVDDDGRARAEARIAGLEVSFLEPRRGAAAGVLHASTLRAGAARRARAPRCPRAPSRPLRTSSRSAGEAYETRASELRTAAGRCRSSRCCSSPLAEGLLPFRRIDTSFFWLALAGARGAGARAASLIARSITAPGAAPGRGRAARAGGRLHAPRRGGAPATRSAQLAVSFNHMLDGIESREKEILRLAYEDGLTALPNRAMFNEQLDQAVTHGQAHASMPLAVLLLRHGPLQGDQRHARPPGGRPGAARGGRARARRCCASRTSWRGWAATSSRCCSPPATRSARRTWWREDPEGARGAARGRRAVDGHRGQHRHRALSRSTARTPTRCCAPPTWRCTRPSATRAASRSTTRRTTSAARSTSRCWASCAARWRTTSWCCTTSPRSPRRRQGVPRSRRWCAGTIRARGFIPPGRLHPVRRADRLHQRHHALGARRAPSRQCGEWHRQGLQLRVSVNVSARDLRSERRARAGRRCGAAPRGAARGAAVPRDHRERPDGRSRAARRPRCGAARARRRRPPSTTTAPATRRSPTSSSCR